MRFTLAIAVCVAAFAASASASRPPATLRIASPAPLVVKGAHFRSAERVAVTVRSAGAVVAARRVVATGTGTFTASFQTLAYDRCNGAVVRAAGSRGTLAVAKLPQPMCLPQ